MNNNDRNRKRNKEKKGPLGIVVMIILAIASFAESAGEDLEIALAIFVGIVVIAGIAALGFKAAKKAAKPAVRGKGPGSAAFENISKWSRDSGETLPSVAARPKTFVYDDRAYERNEARDVQRRLMQLDDFLKNGIIEKEEYRLLRARYERNGK